MKPKERFSIIQELSNTYPIAWLCQLAGVSRSGYYRWMNQQGIVTEKQKENEQIKQMILECHQKVNGIYGYYRVKAWIKRNYGKTVNHKRVYRLMKELGVQAKIRRKKPKYKAGKENIVASNVLNRDFVATAANQKWVTDITYVPFQGTYLYLSAIKDLYNNEIIAYRISRSNDLKLVIETVKDAIKKRDARGVLLHSDQGSQYTSRQYHQLLKAHHIIPSMSRRGNCLDNACMENFFGHLKSEMVDLPTFETEEEMIEAIDQYMYFYNYERCQKKLDYLSPVEYRIA
ncbi:integrase [Geobacillus thermoleovorans]|nr:integrase [Geobacillus thermoleovorans]AST00631.1 transposase [Geobacillus thermocatenulatus]EQB95389.1 integrase [Geobacillus sp. A8]KLR75125.1 integrase [Geobacillus sp. T6]MBO2481428.1 IS3 family transposase [Bacillaceae bacterium]OKO86704.1 Mobile element protein [Geobacillus proteiniphilus]TRY33518.1 IS3 family transposase [Geobacillus sp. LEMMJ02]BAD74444.1 transposase [Geobacillus kaustophilus HTA426]